MVVRKENDPFNRIFGDDVGGLVKGLFMIGVFMVFPFLFIAIEKFFINIIDDKPKTIIQKTDLPKDSLIIQLSAYKQQNDQFISLLTSDVDNIKFSVNNKINILKQLNKQNEFLGVSLNKIKNQPKLSSTNEDLPFSKWITSRATIYSLITAILISAFFFWLGKIYSKNEFENIA